MYVIGLNDETQNNVYLVAFVYILYLYGICDNILAYVKAI